MPNYVKVVEMGRPTDAEEWATRQGSAIADKHMPNAAWRDRSDLASDIAEALTSVRRLWEATVSEATAAEALAASRASDWRAMADAPKDGTIVLTSNPSAGWLPVISWCIEGEWCEHGLYGKVLRPQPTYWRPLPPRAPSSPPPNSGQERA